MFRFSTERSKHYFISVKMSNWQNSTVNKYFIRASFIFLTPVTYPDTHYGTKTIDCQTNGTKVTFSNVKMENYGCRLVTDPPLKIT